MKIQVAGPGCPRCQAAKQNVINACAELDLPADISHVYDAKEYAALGVRMTPAVIVNGRVVCSGRVPTVEELKNLLKAQIRAGAEVEGNPVTRIALRIASGLWCLAAASGAFSQSEGVKPWDRGRLVVSANHRYLQHADGTPFFWMGDTAWRLFQKLTREEAERYLEDRRRKGFNVVQVMIANNAGEKNVYGAPAFLEGDPGRPRITPGSDPARAVEYDYWDHVAWVLERAAEKGLYLGMLPAWCSLVRSGALKENNAAPYAEFLVSRFASQPNIIWINGGDCQGDDHTPVWRILGATLRQRDPGRLISYHPFGGTSSSMWFHNEAWLDFNMFQSGHRRYDQVRPQQKDFWKGEDGWRFVEEDWARTPPKPTLDGEPIYESIPQGLHDPTQPYWNADHVRRYAYWAVFAGACGHTYGHNAVMQMHKPDSGRGAYGVREFWYDALEAPGARQAPLLKNLMLSRPFFERVPDQSLIAGPNGERYERVIATRGQSYAFIYTFTGRPFTVQLGKISGRQLSAWWFNPRDGGAAPAGRFPNRGVRRLVPPGTPQEGNDWVLVLDDASRNYPPPGARRLQ